MAFGKQGGRKAILPRLGRPLLFPEELRLAEIGWEEEATWRKGNIVDARISQSKKLGIDCSVAHTRKPTPEEAAEW